MPHAPGKACSTVGCAGVAAHGYRLCKVCAGERARERRATQAAASRLYNSPLWQRARKVVLLEEPMCRACNRRPSREVDHINGDWRDTRRANLQGLCKRCHSRKTALEQGSFGRGATQNRNRY